MCIIPLFHHFIIILHFCKQSLQFVSLWVTDVFEEVLEIVSYMTYFSPSISLDMWSLWPRMVDAMDEWAIDYFESESSFRCDSV